MSVERQVKAHFEADAGRFDAIYRSEKDLWHRLVDNYWRGVVQKRLELTIQHLEPISGKRILDVGCGSGRFCVAFAARGAERVVGIDFAAAMIGIAREAARVGGVGEICEFRVGSFPETDVHGPFDASTANGFFDYVENPVPIMRRMRELTLETLIMSFPKVFEWRVPVRRIRFWLRGCPLFLYTAQRVRRTLSEAGIGRYDWIDLDRDYFIVAHL